MYHFTQYALSEFLALYPKYFFTEHEAEVRDESFSFGSARYEFELICYRVTSPWDQHFWLYRCPVQLTWKSQF